MSGADGANYVWMGDCIGGSLLSLSVSADGVVLWEIRSLRAQAFRMAPGISVVRYGDAPNGYETVVEPQPLPGGWVQVNWVTSERDQHPLPQGFGSVSRERDSERVERDVKNLCSTEHVTFLSWHG